MEGFNIPEERIFTDKQSGKDFNRPAYRKLVKKLEEGDTLLPEGRWTPTAASTHAVTKRKKLGWIRITV